MIKTEISIPSMGAVIDGSKVSSIDVSNQYDEYYYDSVVLPRQFQTGQTIEFRFKDGSQLTIRRGEYNIVKTVEFELGATYIVSKGDDKWAAVCVTNFDGAAYIRPINRKDATVHIFNTDPKRFEYEYEEFLPNEKIKELL